MVLLALGINHTSASLTVREKLAFAPENMAEALSDAQERALLREVVILSTCNRTELIAICDDNEQAEGGRRVMAWLAAYHHVPIAELEKSCYVYFDDEAFKHTIRVASGLDSMVLGEPQIFGQMKSAFSVAQEAKTINGELGRIFQASFSIAKQVRTDTAIGENPVSVAYAAVSLSQHIFSDLGSTTALLIGAGETIELVARHLAENGVKRIIVANRTLNRARELAQRFDAEAVLLSEIPDRLIESDIVIASTASQLPILGKGAAERALKVRKHKPILMVDIAVPRDIEPQVGDLADIYLYTVDDLKDIIDQNKRSRESEARKADSIIEEGVNAFRRQQRSLDVVSTLKAYRSQAEVLRDSELEKAMRQLENGSRPEEVLCNLARGLTNKLIHTPSVQMKKASAEGRSEMIAWTHELLGLSLDADDSEK